MKCQIRRGLLAARPFLLRGLNMAFDVQRVLAVAENEVGYLEKRNGDLKYLYEKTQNAGTANYTKYGYEMHQIYPAVMDYPAAWCDCFVDWCFQKAYGVSSARKMIGGQFDDYTVQSAALYKKMGAWYAVPKRGDQIFFQNSSRIYHTGIVYHIENDTVYTIEGNTSGGSSVIANGGAVCRKQYPINYSRIAGYGRPAYGKDIAIVEGWRKARDGVRWWYEYTDRSYAVGWKDLNSTSGKHRYYFDENGYMLTGWRQIDGNWYFFETTSGPDEGALYRTDNNGVQTPWTL